MNWLCELAVRWLSELTVSWLCEQEIALLHHSKRTATVESANHMALLSIGRDDFFDIFFNIPRNTDVD